MHLAHAGFPILGDDKYGDFALNKALSRANASPRLARMFLHAHTLRLTHPQSGEIVTFKAPLPAECAAFLNAFSRRIPIPMPQQRFDLIVFDWDGTLMDSTPAITRSIQLACRDLGLPVPDDAHARHVIGLGLRDALEYAVPTLDPADYGRLAERYRFHYLNRDAQLVLFPGVREMLEALRKQHYLLAVATGKSRVGLQRALETTGLIGVFDDTRCADETFSKPHPAMLLELTRELGMDVERTVMVGDTTHDLQMAANAGAAGVAVSYGAHPADVLHALDPLFCAGSVTELHRWLADHA